ncbi:MAG: hypothetical protein HY372_04065 [Candidatus Andersenbacteria bacterium]|nr:hypothetical protein [Candidatus Andersenbacteria bacterium]
MGRLDNLKTTPIGSLLILSEAESDPYFRGIAELPAPLKDLLTAENTGAFTRGLARAYGVAIARAPHIALLIVRLVLGRLPLAKLPGVLATELSLPDDQARRMAAEIERDLLGPVRAELEQYWQTPARPTSPGLRGASNVLNLKETPKPPAPPTVSKQ